MKQHQAAAHSGIETNFIGVQSLTAADARYTNEYNGIVARASSKNEEENRKESKNKKHVVACRHRRLLRVILVSHHHLNAHTKRHDISSIESLLLRICTGLHWHIRPSKFIAIIAVCVRFFFAIPMHKHCPLLRLLALTQFYIYFVLHFRSSARRERLFYSKYIKLVKWTHREMCVHIDNDEKRTEKTALRMDFRRLRETSKLTLSFCLLYDVCVGVC